MKEIREESSYLEEGSENKNEIHDDLEIGKKKKRNLE